MSARPVSFATLKTYTTRRDTTGFCDRGSGCVGSQHRLTIANTISAVGDERVKRLPA
jgi:hypothetical protein